MTNNTYPDPHAMQTVANLSDVIDEIRTILLEQEFSIEIDEVLWCLDRTRKIVEALLLPDSDDLLSLQPAVG